MEYLLIMTFAGSVLLIGYLCWERLMEKYITQSMKYRALMIVLIVYTMPWVWLKEIYIRIFGFFWHEETVADAEGIINIADIKTSDVAYRTEKYRLLVLFVLIWFIIAAIFMIIRIAKYLVRSHALHNLSIKCEDINLEKTLTDLKTDMRFWRRPEIVWTRVDNQTFTLGAIKPVIFLQKDYVTNDLYWILKHEMFHITRMDLVIKLLVEFVCCLHWFNPFVYFLEKELEFVCEASCDERVLAGCTVKEREAYIDLLDRNKSRYKVKIPFSSSLEGKKTNVDRRIKLIKEMKNKNRCGKLVSASAFALLLLINSFTAFAYPKIRHVKSTVIEAAEESIGGGNFWSYDYINEGYGAPVDTILYDEQFIDGAGEITPVDADMTSSHCSDHDIVSGYYQTHIKSTDGSCIVNTYECTKCTICDMIWVGDFYSENTQIICEH